MHCMVKRLACWLGFYVLSMLMWNFPLWNWILYSLVTFHIAFLPVQLYLNHQSYFRNNIWGFYIIRTIFSDLTEAFGLVTHKHFLQKSHDSGLSSDPVKWLSLHLVLANLALTWRSKILADLSFLVKIKGSFSLADGEGEFKDCCQLHLLSQKVSLLKAFLQQMYCIEGMLYGEFLSLVTYGISYLQRQTIYGNSWDLLNRTVKWWNLYLDIFVWYVEQLRPRALNGSHKTMQWLALEFRFEPSS